MFILLKIYVYVCMYFSDLDFVYVDSLSVWFYIYFYLYEKYEKCEVILCGEDKF